MARKDLIQVRGGTAEEWADVNPILAVREMGWDQTAKRFKIGDGVTAWVALDYATDAVGLTEVQWADVLGKPTAFQPSAHRHPASEVDDLADVAVSGNYADLDGTPIFAAVALSGQYADLLNKPVIPTTPGQVGADPAGSAATAKAEAITAAGIAAGTALNTHTSRTDNPHAVTKAQVGLGNVANLAPLALPLSTATSNALAAKADLVDGIIPTSQLPAVSTSETLFVANQAARLALTPAQAQGGDLVIEQDTGRKWWCTGAADLSQPNAWVRVDTDAAVVSVNGQTGIIVLGKTDVGLDLVPNVDATLRANHTGTQSALTVDESSDRKWMTAAERSRLVNALTDLVIRSTTATRVVGSRVSGDSNDRFTIEADGRMRWGAGGTSAVDTTLYRNSTNNLRASGAFTADGTLQGNIVLVGQSAQPGAANAATRKDYVDAQIVAAKDRANHTGSQDVSTVSGLGTAATKNVGAAAGTVAAGDDSRFMTPAERDKIAAAPEAKGFAGNWWAPWTGTQTSTATLSINTLFWYPMEIPKAQSLNLARIEVTTGNTGAQLRAGIWATDPITGLPGDLIVDLGTVDTSTVGAKDFVANGVVIPAGRVWFGYIANGTASSTVRCINFTGLPLTWPAGVAPGANTGAVSSIIRNSISATTPLPNPANPNSISTAVPMRVFLLAN